MSPPSVGRPLKILKQSEIPAKEALSKASLKRQRKEDLLKNPKNTHRYIINGQEVYKPYHKHGYNEKGKIADPNSARSKARAEKGTGKGKGGDGLDGKCGNGGDAIPNTLRETFYNPFLDSKICALDGTNLRQLRDGLGLCSPAIVLPEQRQPKTPREAIRKVLLEVSDRDILTSERSRSTDMLKALQEKFLDKWVRKLMEVYRICQGRQ